MNLPTIITNAVTAFDYSALDADTANLARAMADTIRSRHRNTIKLLLDTGRDLLEIKERLGHGHFGKWLKAEFDWTERTAERYMQAAERFADKSDTVSDLPPTIVYQLSSPSTPATVRDEIVSQLDQGEAVSVPTIRDMIREAKEAQRKAEEEARKTPAQRKRDRQRRERERREREEWRARFEAEQVARKSAIDQAASLIHGKLGPDLARLIELLDEAGIRDLADALRPDDDFVPAFLKRGDA